MSTPDFDALLSSTGGDVKRPPTLPSGTYYGIVTKYEQGKSRDKQTPYYRFHVQIQEAGADISPSDLEGIDLSKKSLRTDFYLTHDAAYRLKDFIESCGIDTSGLPIKAWPQEVMNAEVMMTVVPSKNEGFTEIKNISGRKS